MATAKNTDLFTFSTVFIDITLETENQDQNEKEIIQQRDNHPLFHEQIPQNQSDEKNKKFKQEQNNIFPNFFSGFLYGIPNYPRNALNQQKMIDYGGKKNYQNARDLRHGSRQKKTNTCRKHAPK